MMFSIMPMHSLACASRSSASCVSASGHGRGRASKRHLRMGPDEEDEGDDGDEALDVDKGQDLRARQGHMLAQRPPQHRAHRGNWQKYTYCGIKHTLKQLCTAHRSVQCTRTLASHQCTAARAQQQQQTACARACMLFCLCSHMLHHALCDPNAHSANSLVGCCLTWKPPESDDAHWMSSMAGMYLHTPTPPHTCESEHTFACYKHTHICSP
eukprot:1436725-Rhodomonas_salina.4